ncbi:uncharacterized protein A4U43_C05F35630 [Asparagus officinalis]|uniref:Protein kinase domain-containing protein n=1 Tax=Asparagus officinalis TaxID=4686 RepID=A0A5P1F1F8_ASPOF|nr:uncharacterized protein A4U43_C05F35630 [Asparagus officinalis]
MKCPGAPSEKIRNRLMIDNMGNVLQRVSIISLDSCCSLPPAASEQRGRRLSSFPYYIRICRVDRTSWSRFAVSLCLETMLQLARTPLPAGEITQEEKLTFLQDGGERFELQDLLRASAEVLGSGNFGSSYKAVLIEGPSVAVKRFKEMNRVGREDFQEHMRRLGRLSHPNVLPLVAYYYRKEEKLIITNYILNGSLAHMLHGNRGSNLPPLGWPTRLKIIKGVARGLAYLYEELPMLILPHGHLKSSNVLIDDNYEALLTDYALVPLVNNSHASQVMVAYKAPEVTETGKPSKKSDVWSLGILILEVLTGQFPAIYLQKGKGGGDLAGWVNSVVKEEAFDSEMKSAENGEKGQMSKLLHIGLRCCEPNADNRWDIKEALDRIEELKGTGAEEEEEDSSLLSEVALGSSS